MRPALAIGLYLVDKRVVLVGVGAGADERAKRLELARARVVRVLPEAYVRDDISDAFLVMAQSGDSELDRRIALDARDAGVLAYAHDQPEVSDFAMPSVARRGPLTIAIATSATAPALARKLGRELQRMLDAAGASLDQLLSGMASARTASGPARYQRLAELADTVRVSGELTIDSQPDS